MLREAKGHTTVDDIVHQITGLVVSGELKAGDRLPGELELMETLKVGRSSVREAKRILSTRGLVESFPGKGSFVRRASLGEILDNQSLRLLLSEEVNDLYELRKFLEVHILGLAVQRATDDDLQRLSDVLDQFQLRMREGGDWISLGIRFHISLAEATHNSAIVKIYSIIATMLHEMQRGFYELNQDLSIEYQIHRDILDCLVARDLDHVEEVMERHFYYVERITSKALD